MSDTNQITEQIFSNIDIIGEQMEKTVDLSSDVAPFMASTLTKIKQLALAKGDNVEAQYELFQIATNYLPRTVNAYCAFPMEYRNTRPIKANKTARQLLIEDLKIFKQQVIDIEKQFYESLESQIKVTSNVVRQKYEHKFQLATETETLGEEGFVNQFDFDKYENSPDYKNIKFKREKNQEDLAAQKRAESFHKTVENVVEESKCLVTFLRNKFIVGFHAFDKACERNADELVKCLTVLFWVFVIGGGGYFIVSLIASLEKPSRLYDATIQSSRAISSVMAVSLVPKDEFEGFAKAKFSELTDGSDYRKEQTKFQINPTARTLEIKVSGLSKDRCMNAVDEKERFFDGVDVRINGIPLPENNIVSTYSLRVNGNHKLCYLKENNYVTLDFDNQKIYDFAKAEKALPSDEKVRIYNVLSDESERLKKTLEKYRTNSALYGKLYLDNTEIESIMNRMK